MSAITRLPSLLAVVVLLSIPGCGKNDASGPGDITLSRTYQMGFSGTPPKPDVTSALASITMWSTRADAAMLMSEPPWDSLLAGALPESLVAHDQLGLATFYRMKGLSIWIQIDPENGVDRSTDSDGLKRHGRSMTDPAIQTLYRRYAIVMDSIVHPDHMGLALETNLIRVTASAALYDAIRKVTNEAAADVRARDSAVKLSVSIQADLAWGHLAPGHEGVAQDIVDFPFCQELGLSSYPYLGAYRIPEDIPSDYYSRLKAGFHGPVYMSEGGWSSATVDSTVPLTREMQSRYLRKQAALLQSAQAIGFFQTLFADLDPVSWGIQPGSILPYFVHIGLTDSNFIPKPALATWDSLFAVPRQ